MNSARAKPAFIVAIGGSVDGLPAFNALLRALPATTGMAFVVVSHMPSGARSRLTEILSLYTKMDVIAARTGMSIHADHVYVNSPDSDVLIENGVFKLVYPRRSRNREGDRFFNSLADAMGARAIAVILSGYDGDGAAACGHITARGGKAFAQDTALPPEEIASLLEKLASGSYQARLRKA